jgi:hypothetical protein
MRAGALPVVAQERLYSARPKDDLLSLSLEMDWELIGRSDRSNPSEVDRSRAAHRSGAQVH